MLKVVCAWCGVTISDGELKDGHPSHGICTKCYDEQKEQIDLFRKENPKLWQNKKN